MSESWTRKPGQTAYQTNLLASDTLYEQAEAGRTVVYQKCANGAKLIVDLGRGTYDIAKARKLLGDTVVSVTHEVSVTAEGLGVTCEQCGNLFVAARSTARFCSASCRVKAARKK